MNCVNELNVAQVLTVVFTGLSSLLTIWLAHRRKKADRERRRFYWQMRKQHRLPVSEDDKARSEKGEFL